MIDISQEIWDLADKHLDKVRRSGSDNIMSVCPFHDDTSPSFAMSLINGVYFCHACHAKGSLRTFLLRMGVPKAQLQRQFKVLVDEARRATPPPPDPLNTGVFEMKPIPDEFLGLLSDHPDNLLKAGFTAETLDHFEIGIDHHHGRVVYPLRDIQGNLVGISGRTIHKDVKPKYKIYNTEYMAWGLPERHGWDKRKVLYNAHEVYPVLVRNYSREHEVFIVEGFNAAMWLWQAGYTNVLALLGTYMSYEHQWILERLSGTAYLFLDNNDPGLEGTLEAGAKLSTSSTLRVRVIDYPSRLQDNEDAQPDDLEVHELVEQKEAALPYYTWMNKLITKWDTESLQETT